MNTNIRGKNTRIYGEMAEFIGQRIKEARRWQGMPLRHLAKTTQISISFLSDVENGKALPSLIAYSLICYHLEIDPVVPILDYSEDSAL